LLYFSATIIIITL